MREGGRRGSRIMQEVCEHSVGTMCETIVCGAFVVSRWVEIKLVVLGDVVFWSCGNHHRWLWGWGHWGRESEVYGGNGAALVRRRRGWVSMLLTSFFVDFRGVFIVFVKCPLW